MMGFRREQVVKLSKCLLANGFPFGFARLADQIANSFTKRFYELDAIALTNTQKSRQAK